MNSKIKPNLGKNSLLIALVFLISVVFPALSNSSNLPIIPSENSSLFGMTTPAGSGRHQSPPTTNICRVTNLLDSGVGSLRHCIEARSPKTIVFEVGGTISLERSLSLGSDKLCDSNPETTPGGIDYDTGNYVTIAGQTAPSPGITLKGETFRIERNCHDILVQHIRFRTGDLNPDGNRPEQIDSMVLVNSYNPSRGWYPPERVIIDHNSFSWAVDETVETAANNSSFINNIFTDPLHGSIHPKGSHPKGLVMTGYGSGSQNVLVARNLFAHSYNRNPKMSAGTAAIVNNVAVDVAEGFRLESMDARKATVLSSVVGNYIATGEQMRRPIYVITRYGTHDDARFFIDKTNFFDGAVQSDPWSKISTCGNFGTSCSEPVKEQHRVAEPPVWPVGMQAMTAVEAREFVLQNAGARPADRDAVDEHLIATLSFENAPMEYVDCVECTNAQCVAAGEPRACCDGPGQGTCRAAPVGWAKGEPTRRSLDIPEDPMALRPSGYTALEEYLHALAAGIERGEIPSPVGLSVQ